MKIILFTRNSEIKSSEFPQRDGLDFQHVQFCSSKLEDLLLVAKYKIVNYPMSLVVDNRGKILLKIKGLISDSYIDNLIDR